MLRDLDIRKNEMLALQKSIQELNQLFVEMAVLIDEQGIMVDNILEQTQNTEAYVSKANEEIAQAVSYQSGARRKKIWLSIACIVAIIIIVLIVVLSLKPWQK